ncbi:helix-turn-helix DNA binding protein [Gordonia phage Syleon]|uniref:Helix-turn-helix DNA binding domain protein n=3 Tax=Octobienvirus TaxID=3044779 RepID=A0AAE8Y655_9CAUD|nr:helix-turn-helix DNA binding domain protein [Gordonia Phage Sephiroth]YP_010246524.1 helix-turn-helix DNA binding domain protein [Gordonia phage Kudefre]YP_010246665.1 helix-turn-helix DNA binding protein [Gordonia phage Syleon]QGH75735.1 helix-turn-helix DNA binding protein [Gordonia phage Syleon]QNN99350.1 helix-turn-helix DNA binding domain protein [Gordonia Phage Sephiroth]UDL15240.1 helix-turn-helix DNA binding domain protein [Gordonia phage Kudefre]
MALIVPVGLSSVLDMTTPQFLTAEQLAERWQLAPRTVREMAQAEEIPAIKFGRLWRFPLERIEKFERAAA